MTLVAHGCEYDFRLPYELRPGQNQALNTGGDVGEMVCLALSTCGVDGVFCSSYGIAMVFEGGYHIGSMGGAYCIRVTLHIDDGAAKGRISVGHSAGHGLQDMAAEHELAVARHVLKTLESVLLSSGQPSQ